MPLALEDLRTEKIRTVEIQSKKEYRKTAHQVQTQPKLLTQSYSSTIKEKKSEIRNASDIKENNSQSSNQEIQKMRATSREDRKPGQEKEILDWFETKFTKNERRKPKEIPNFNPNESINQQLNSRDFTYSPFEKSHFEKEKNWTKNTQALYEMSSQKMHISHMGETDRKNLKELLEYTKIQTKQVKNFVLTEETTQEDLNEKLRILEGRLEEIKRNKERLKSLKERNMEDDKKEMMMLSGVLEVQKKDVKELLEDIRKMKEVFEAQESFVM